MLCVAGDETYFNEVYIIQWQDSDALTSSSDDEGFLLDISSSTSVICEYITQYQNL